MKVFNYSRNYNRRTNTHNFLRHDYQIRNASSFKKHERRGENVELKDLTCVTVIFTLKVIIDWNVPSKKLLVPFEIHDFSFYQKSLIEQFVTESERNTKVKRRGTINSSITSNCPRVSQSLTIARSFSYEADCVIASRMLATGSRGNKRRTAQRKLLKEVCIINGELVSG
ncbi:uncharacterized protein LOC126873889 [Bombus huntii]|uniref:uncharacterized protein LOC126873889 n=1 Tax=Bombus huntii TaxID=85661 RepID=UPI0021AA5806|nr:uncharacterized protein LOC126873889 [Bombus huntii]